MNHNWFKPAEAMVPHFHPLLAISPAPAACGSTGRAAGRSRAAGALTQPKAYQQKPLRFQLHQFPSPTLGVAGGVLVPAEGKGKA